MVADDVHGLLSAIAGALAANRIDVLGAIVGPRRADAPEAPHVALDLFYVRDLYNRAIPADDPRWERFRRDLGSLVSDGGVNGAAVEALMTQRRSRSGLGSRVTPDVPTRVTIDNHASADATIIEVITRDGAGVLYAITHTLAELGLDIRLSKVGTEGERVIDVFYVTDSKSQVKITDSEFVDQIEQCVREALVSARRELP